MKLKAILTLAASALIAAMALSSCQKQAGIDAGDGYKSVALSINFGTAFSTKANIDSELEDKYVNDSKDLTSIQVYFTDASGLILYAYSGDANSTADSDSRKVWDGLTDNGVRFIGMEGISHVYVTANGPELFNSYDGAISNPTVKISELNALYTSDVINVEQKAVPYAGADKTLDAPSSTVSTSTPYVIVNQEGYDANYFTAEISIRPVVSRLEVNNVSVRQRGDVFYEEDATSGNLVRTTDETNAKYKVSYSNFKPTLVGLYMSKCYLGTNIFSATPAAGTLFDTPGFGGSSNGPIEQGKWTAASLSDAWKDYLSYANYDTAYGNLTGYTAKDDATDTYKWILYDNSASAGTTYENKVIPFNFYVPYDITSTASSDAVSALSGAVMPKLHFQFKAPTTGTADDYTIKVYDRDATNNNEWSTSELTTSVAEQLAAQLKWPVMAQGESGIAFANVVKFVTDATDPDNSGVTVQPGYIYRIQEVLVAPTDIVGSPNSTELYNVFVVVTVVPFTAKDVYPVLG